MIKKEIYCLGKIMKFSKIYSNLEKFREVKFNTDINFVLSDSHSVGKTKFLELIDFCLLKENSFVKNIGLSEDVAFFLEIDCQGKYITIKRYINKRQGIFIHEESISKTLIDFNDNSFKYKKLGLSKAKETLNEILDLRLNNRPINYRKYINYFLRTQDDQSDVFRLNKYNRSKDKDFKPIIAEMLGIKGECVTLKYDIENEINDLRNKINEIKTSLQDQSREYIEAEISHLENRIKEKQELYDQFNFFEEDNARSKELVKNIESKIVKFNKEKSSLLRELKYAQDAIETTLPIDTAQLEEFFEQINVTFPNELKNDFENVIKFNKTLVEDRKKILEKNIHDFQQSLDYVNEELFNLNKERSKILEFLIDKDAMDKFKQLESEIMSLKVKLEFLKQKLSEFDLLDEYIKREEELNLKLKKVNRIIKKLVKRTNTGKFIKIINHFSKLIFGEDAIFVVSLNTNNNLEFQLKISDIDGNYENLKDEGHTYRKLLSFLFSLSVAIYHIEEKFFRFVAIDSPFDGDIEQYQEGLYKAIVESSQKGLQIIATSIEDEIKISTIKNEILGKYTILYLKDDDKLLMNF
jgi:uncharacterized protein YydD (DUF2326 family)